MANQTDTISRLAVIATPILLVIIGTLSMLVLNGITSNIDKLTDAVSGKDGLTVQMATLNGKVDVTNTKLEGLAVDLKEIKDAVPKSVKR